MNEDDFFRRYLQNLPPRSSPQSSPPTNAAETLLRYLTPPPKPKIFVSYHHRNDQGWYDRFSQLFSNVYELFTDTSIERKIDSDDSEYQSRYIREQHITGSSLTIVLCGAETWKRKHVDWEIYATLEKEHALLGVILPTCQKTPDGKVIVPDRLHQNCVTGYARFMDWSENPQAIASGISVARNAVSARLVNNSLPQMGKNLT